MTDIEAPRGHTDDVVEEAPPPRYWRRRQRDVANITWISFLMAGIATMVFFANVDPDVLSETTTVGWDISRETGYAIGFFMFWLLTAGTATLTTFLIRTEHRPEEVPNIRRRLRALKERRQARRAERSGKGKGAG